MITQMVHIFDIITKQAWPAGQAASGIEVSKYHNQGALD